jgi:hypothetical protein
MDRETRGRAFDPRAVALPLCLSVLFLTAPAWGAIGPSPSDAPGDIVGVQVTPGLQFMLGDGSQPYLDLRAGEGTVLHRPSGRSCPKSLAGGAIVLNQIDAADRSLHCLYREGPSRRFDPDARIKYQILIVRDSASVNAVMKDLATFGRQALPIAANKTPPLETGAAPRPQAALFWTLQDGSVQGVWMSKARGWLVRLQVDYPETPANDAEARAVAEALFQPSAKAGR